VGAVWRAGLCPLPSNLTRCCPTVARARNAVSSEHNFPRLHGFSSSSTNWFDTRKPGLGAPPQWPRARSDSHRPTLGCASDVAPHADRPLIRSRIAELDQLPRRQCVARAGQKGATHLPLHTPLPTISIEPPAEPAPIEPFSRAHPRFCFRGAPTLLLNAARTRPTCTDVRYGYGTEYGMVTTLHRAFRQTGTAQRCRACVERTRGIRG
jgi:hypothetical protein